ncbi:MAG: pyruvate formate lyase family protein, partial [bacterium]
MHKLWSPAQTLSPRVQKLRSEFFSFYDRDYFRNEVLAFTTGAPWDSVWSPHQWSVVPELFPFFAAVRDSLLASAHKVKMPHYFWREPLVIRRALFFKEVLENHLPVKILDGELIVGAQFNTALSKCHTKQEAKKFETEVKKWLVEARKLNDAGIGNCGAIPGHLIPDYPKILKKGFSGVWDELTETLENCKHSPRKDLLKAMILCCEAATNFAQRYA